MSDDDKVVWLAYANPETISETIDVLACGQCRNKTYRIEIFPECAGRLYCCACGTYIGKIGWMPDDE